MTRMLILTATAMIALGAPLHAQNIDFGNDGGEWANDNECDDARFEGPGMTDTQLMHDDIMRDASDCYSAFNAGQLWLRGVGDGQVNFGDDSGEWARDGECDDMRFAGPGMTGTTLLQEDIMRDATDCKTAYDGGRLWLVGVGG